MQGDDLSTPTAPRPPTEPLGPDAAPDPVGEAVPPAESAPAPSPLATARDGLLAWWRDLLAWVRSVPPQRRQLAMGLAVVAACGIYVFWVVHPELVLRNTTPTGGDMGAHVWGPAYLRDHLLPQLRLTGWTPDWYSGFPAYTFYMVVPSLAIVLLDVGIVPWWLFPVVAVGAGYGALAVHRRLHGPVVRALAFTACVLAPLLVLDVPYNIAFKLVAVSGVVTLPGAVWYLARGLGLRFAGPELLAIGTIPFLMDQSLFHIYGGNIASTMAGEFAFSISLSLGVLFLGVCARGLATGRHRAWGALLLALCALCHVIPLFFVLVGAGLLWILRPTWRALRWLTTVAVPAGLLAAFWYVPFIGNSNFMNDMGWEKLGPIVGPDGQKADNLTEYLRYLFPFAPHTQDSGNVVQDPNMLHGRVFFVLAVIGVILSLVLVVRAGLWLTLMTGISALAFWLMPQTRFWNARVLPFYYLAIYLLAALGVWLVIRAVVLVVRGSWASPPERVGATAVAVGFAVVLVVMGIAIREIPGGKLVTRADGTTAYSWMGIETTYSGPVRGWAAWNFAGLEGKDAWPEFRGLLTEMGRVGEEEGCGRSFWEYGNDFLGRYGTPMAPMMLPYFTDGCIGSQEGLYFEASATTPFHFLMQDELSAQCSCAQRFDHFGIDPSPYRKFDLDEGIRHLQMLGVRYYLAFSDTAKAAADADARLRVVGNSGPWRIYEVSGVRLAEGLTNEPVVWDDVSDNIHEWAVPSVPWFQDPAEADVLPASSGPDEWPRVDAGDPLPRDPVGQPAEVTDYEAGRQYIRFHVDEPGKPVVVRTSYFPNWTAKGAEGPYRVAPNLMVVVPTDTTVELTYGRSGIELLSGLASLLGLVLLLGLVRRGDPEPAWTAYQFPGDRDDDGVRRRRRRVIPGVTAVEGEPAPADPEDEPVDPEPSDPLP